MKYIEECRVKINRMISAGIFEMELESFSISRSSKPGQFLQIKVNNQGDPLLRRPISISEIKENTLVIYYKSIGKGTDILSKVKKDEIINVVGPLGNGFNTEYEGLNIGIVGGGIGIAPLLQLAKAVKKDNKVYTYLGFNDTTYLVDSYASVSDQVKVSTVTGKEGSKGFITDVLKEEMDINKFDLIYACGPKKMLIKISELAEEKNIKCQISLEEKMACGFGACLGCSIETTDGTMKKVCNDGPVFWSNEVIIDE